MSFLRFLWSALGRSRSVFVGAMAMSLLDGLTAAMPPLLAGLALAHLMQPDLTAAALIPYGGGIMLAVIIRMIIVRPAWIWGFAAGNAATEAIRNRLLDHMRRTPLGIYQRWTPARLATLITDDGRWINEASSFYLTRVVAGSATTLVLLLATIYLEPLIGLVMSLVFTAGLLALPFSAELLARLIERRSQHVAETNQRVGEYADGIGVFRLFGREGPALARVRAAFGELRDTMVTYTPKIVLLGQISAALIASAIPLAIAAIATAVLWTGHAAEPSSIIPALFLALAARNALQGDVLKQAGALHLGLQAHKSISKFLAEPVLPGSSCDFDPSGGVGFKDVSFRYSENSAEVLSAMSFAIAPGQLVAIVGPSGAGKSTVVALLLRFFDAEHGAVTIDGLDVKQADPAALLARIALVNQDVHLFHATLRANIMIGDPAASDARLASAIKAAHLDDVVAALPDGLDTVLGSTGRTLSGGERQRVAIARALLKEAPILVLDEATSALDPLTERAIRDAISLRQSRQTVIVVAHRLARIADADQILVLDHGKLVEHGGHEDLLSRGGRYSRLWNAQRSNLDWRLS